MLCGEATLELGNNNQQRLGPGWTARGVKYSLQRCHAERSRKEREAILPAESKHPYLSS